MPIYEYKCRDCGKISEFLVGVGQEEAEFKCSSCASKKLEKIFSQSVVSKSGHIVGSQGGRLAHRSPSGGGTCCGRTERCDTPPCSDGGVCVR